MLDQLKEEKPVKRVSERVKYFNEDEYSQEDIALLSKLYNDSFKDIREGEILAGTIVGINDDNVVVDVGFKSDGTIAKSEFNATDEIKIGQSVDIVIESVEDEEGNLVLSKKRADFLKIWSKIIDAFDNEKNYRR